MKKVLLSASLSALLVLGACSDDSDRTQIYAPPILSLPAATSPVDLQGADATFVRDVAYGEDERQVFDIFMPKSATPTPLIIWIHGGGFTGGEKEGIYRTSSADIARYLNSGAAFVTSTYRLLQAVDGDGVSKPLNDSKYALQFIRHHAKQFNIDPNNIAIYGGSAGAGTALWLAASDDMAEPAAADRVLRESTRISAAGAIETQASYDILRWLDAVFVEFGLTFDLIFFAQPALEQTLFSFYGVGSRAAVESDPEVAAFRASVDMLKLLTSDDPEIFVSNTRIGTGLPLGVDALFHHPFHARELMEAAQAGGVVGVYNIPQMGITDTETAADFMLRKVGL